MTDPPRDPLATAPPPERVDLDELDYALQAPLMLSGVPIRRGDYYRLRAAVAELRVAREALRQAEHHNVPDGCAVCRALAEEEDDHATGATP